MTKPQFLQVFVDENNNFGDKVPIVMDQGRKISDDQRTAIAADLQQGKYKMSQF